MPMGTAQLPGAVGLGHGPFVAKEMKAPSSLLCPSAWTKSSRATWGHALLPAPQALLKGMSLEAGAFTAAGQC